ncbi:MAG: AMP-binding protein [Candidatus Binatia bacterium]|nr:AMP-binding protein [Candidatus Binatia bacterium]
MSDNLFETLYAGFEPRLDEPFLRPQSGPAWSYRDVVARSGRLAGALRRAGATVGDRVVIQVDKSPDAIATYLACLRIGAVYMPLNVAYTADEIGYYLGDAAPTTFVCRPANEARLASVATAHDVRTVLTLDSDGGGTLLREAEHGSPFDDVVPRTTSDLAAMLYTSGTTGKPKGAMITHENLATNARALYETWGWQPEDVLLHALPVFHVHGLFVALHCAMLGGSAVEFLPRFEPTAVRAALARSSVMMGVPTFYSRLLAEPAFDREECTGIRLFISGSAPLPETVFRAFVERTGHTVLERYGMTETGILTSNPLDGARIGGTVGFPLPGVETRVVRDDGRPSAPGETGSVEVRGPGVFAGYWNNPEKTKAEMRDDGFFRTGDLGTQAADGRIALVGRSSDMIISCGYNVYPKEIELCLDELPGVVESAVVGLPHPDFGEAVSAFVVCGATKPGAAQLLAGMEGRLARFKHPKRIFFVDSLPRNAMGKVQKAVLRTENAAAFASEEG